MGRRLRPADRSHPEEAQSFGGMQTVSRPLKGGLSPWQEGRSKEMIAGDLTGATPLREIAEACGLSTSHFSRAFRKSTGLAPHAWLIQSRVKSAKAMLRKNDASLFTIARACGFADQSHFARVFKRRVGLSPGAWRKMALGCRVLSPRAMHAEFDPKRSCAATATMRLGSWPRVDVC
jgi:AraC-like DNA-binding protein